MEFVPFSANFARAALLAFGLALVAHDGLFGPLAFILSTTTLFFVAYGLFWKLRCKARVSRAV
jgi:hypothetical protein